MVFYHFTQYKTILGMSEPSRRGICISVLAKPWYDRCQTEQDTIRGEKHMNQAKVYEELVTIPTYRTGNMEKDPLFIEKRAYQGSTGKVYPVPICEKISETREDVEYKAVILENDYLYVMILPELGGRIQRALDKINGYDFVYYNRVIKPALVGLAGP